MDPLSVSASVTGILAVAMKVAAILKEYVGDVRSALPDAHSLLVETTALCECLEKFLQFLRADAIRSCSLAPSSAMRLVLAVCDARISKLHTKLTKFHNSRSLAERLKWPFDKRDYAETLQFLRHCTQTFGFSATITTYELLSKTSNEVKASLDEQTRKMESFASFLPELARAKAKLEDIAQLMVMLPQLLSELGEITTGVRGLEREAKDARLRELLNWLSPLEPLKRHQDVLSIRALNTGNWFLESELFLAWKNNHLQLASDQVLCCYGMPGAGKTVLSCTVIDHLRAPAPDRPTGTLVGISCLYSDYRDQDGQTCANILGSLLQQALVALPNVPDTIINTLDAVERKKERLSQQDVLTNLKLAFQSFQHGFLCIDALDELKQHTRTEVLNAIRSLVNDSKIKIFLTGRPHIQTEVDRSLGFSPKHTIELTANPNDVCIFLHKRLKEDQIPEAMNADLRDMIVNTITTKSHGMFLLPALQIQVVLEKPTIRGRKDALRSLPNDLLSTFQQTISRIENTAQGEVGMQVLKWVHLAKRPLMVSELQHALAVRVGDTDLDRENILPSTHLLIRYCLGLVTIDEETSTVRLVHYTLQEYFGKHGAIHFPNGLNELAGVCLTYLNFDKLAAASYTFSDYAACYWGDYARAQWSPSICTLTLRLLREEAKVGPVISTLLSIKDLLITRRTATKFGALHLAAYFGLSQVTQVLLTAGFQSDIKDEWSSSPLSWAARKGHEAVVRLLVERADVDADSKDDDGRTPLSYAAGNGHMDIVRLLVERADVDADSKNKYGQTPLSHAAIYGHMDIASLLVERADVDVDSNDGYGRTPLSHAAENGHMDIVRLLVERADVDADSKENRWRTPLSYAAEYGHMDIVRLLVERADVDADSKDIFERTPLSYAAQYGHMDIVRLLVERADVDADSNHGYGRTPLSYAAGNGHMDIVRLLVERADVDADSKDNNGWTPLSHAAGSGHMDIVRLLVEQADVDADSKDNDGRSPLSYAAEYGRMDIVRLLVERADVDADSKDNNGWTPLSYAAGSGHMDIVRLLVERADVDADSKENRWRTPLSYAAGSGHMDIVRLLVERADVDADSKDNDGRSPLSYAAGNEDGYEIIDIVRLLVERADVDADSKDNDGRSPLSYAAGNEDGYEIIDIVRLLVERADVDADSKDNNGRTPLSYAAGSGHMDIVRLLVERADVDVDSKDIYGLSPLSYAPYISDILNRSPRTRKATEDLLSEKPNQRRRLS